MKKSVLLARFAATVAFAFTAGATMAESFFKDPVNVTLNLRIKVEGNVAAINQGLGIRCSLVGSTRLEPVFRQILSPGQIFVPETSDGFVETSITFENLSQDHPLLFQNKEGEDYNPAFSYVCHAVQIGASGDWELVYDFEGPELGMRVFDPVYHGSCPYVGTLIDHAGEFPFVPRPICAN